MRILSLLLVTTMLAFALIAGSVTVHASDAGRVVIASLTGPDTITTDGGPYTFSVKAIGGTPPYYYQWDVNGYLVKDNSDTISVPANELEGVKDESGGPWVSVTVEDSEVSNIHDYYHEAVFIDKFSGDPDLNFRIEYSKHLDSDGNFAGYWTGYKTPSEWPYSMPPVPVTVTPTTTPIPDLTDSGARFSSLSGQVEVRHDYDEKNWAPAKMNTVLDVDDHVKTSEDSSAIIGFADLSTFLLKSESEIVVSTPPAHDSKIGLVLGNIWVNVKKMANDGTMEVDMSQAVAGIKGTVFEAESNATSSTVKGIVHNVTVISKANGQTVIIGPGEMVTATSAGLGPVTTFNVSDEAAKYGVSSDNLTQDPVIIAQTTSGTTSGSSASSGGICGILALLPLLAIGVVFVNKRMKNR